MKSILVFLALGVLASAAPINDISRVVKRADVDTEISDAGFIPVRTNALWCAPRSVGRDSVGVEKLEADC
ncbi:uncharacterized protein GGS25DRAFT_516630 [Hypoxylon fragiforme]|uniref:uncharacterized protein n=1 Tax=Hypoxylon fragiforme TaxID=63214 RepID=UPI0020C727ED|nr:uncharacterized protein GGS25DRAFT_516630 [Hypoxylon fragiforme]KAI2613767.1 hypothetical protein GGS25DRAFT_516630 [Hypoxylon fragiforme]